MWLFLSDAYLSVVQHRDDPGKLLVRARIKGDIERALPGVKAEETPSADYRFRAIVARGEFAARLAAIAQAIDYDNFKASVPERARHDVYMKIWSIMATEQARRVR